MRSRSIGRSPFMVIDIVRSVNVEEETVSISMGKKRGRAEWRLNKSFGTVRICVR